MVDVAAWLAELATRATALARIPRDYPALWRWYLGNRARQLTLPVEYHLGREGYSAPPRSISFRPTFLCNARCRMCSYANSIDPDTLRPITANAEMLDEDTARALVDAVAPAHTMLNITGGEPFAWGERLFRLLAHGRARGVATSVTTNGTLIGRHLPQLLASPPDVLIVSLLGPRPVHDATVGMPAFEEMRAALRELQARKGGDRMRPPLVVANTAMLPENLADLPEVPRLAAEMGAVVSSFQPLWTTTEEMHASQRELVETYDHRYTANHEVDPQAMAPAQIWAQLRRARQVGRAHGMQVNVYPRLRRQELEPFYHQPERSLGRTRALCAHLISQVLPDGSVSPCLGHTVGNLHDESFPAIWNGPAMRDFRQRLKAACLFPICTRCCVLWRND